MTSTKSILWDFAGDIGVLVEKEPTPLELSRAMELLADAYAKRLDQKSLDAVTQLNSYFVENMAYLNRDAVIKQLKGEK